MFKENQNPYYEYAWQNKWQGGGPLGLPQDCAAKMNVVKYRTAEYLNLLCRFCCENMSMRFQQIQGFYKLILGDRPP